MSRSFEMRPGIGIRRGAPHGEVRIPIVFRLPVVEAPPPAKPLSAAAKALAARLVASSDPAPGFLAYYDAEAAKLEAPPPGVEREAGAEAAKALRAAAQAKAPALRQAIGEAIAARLTDAELAEFVAFAESDVGRRWFAADPTQRDKHQRLNRVLQQRIQEEARKTFCRSRDCASAAPQPNEPSPRAERADPDAPLIYVPWNQQPTVAETLAAWPISSLFGIAGYAVSTCTLGLQGAPEDCTVTYESPRALGVAAAAQRLNERYRVAPEFLASGAGKRVSIFAYFWPGVLAPPATAPPPAIAQTRFALARRLAELQSQRLGSAIDETSLASLRTRLAPLDAGLRRDAEAALVAARDATQSDLLDGRARIAAEAYDEDALRRIVRFEEALRPAIQRAANASEPELKAVGKVVGEQVSNAARATFCKRRDCDAPVFTQPPPTAANPEPSTRNP
jgi:hypothetical protein